MSDVKTNTKLVILLGVIAVIALSIACFFVFFHSSRLPELTVLDSNFNGTHLEVKLGLKTNTTIHPYGIQGVNVEVYEEWTKTDIRFGDSLTLLLPIIGDIEPNKKYHLKFLLLCDEGKLSFDVDIELD